MKVETTLRRSSWISSTFTGAPCAGGVFDPEVIECRPGILIFRPPKQSDSIFLNEHGGHRWQRVPPNERNGRVHTSTITVAVLREPSNLEVKLNEGDLIIRCCRGSGKGGQNRNKLDTAVQITHKPSGLSVHCEAERSQLQNKETALALLRSRLLAQMQERQTGNISAIRRGQIGSGMRGDKRRTIRQQHGVVVDHVTGREWRFEEYRAGNL